jgi:hypothetical protein
MSEPGLGREPKQGAAIGYAALSLISLGIAILVGWYLLGNAAVSLSSKASARAYYFLLVILGLSSAAFLFGAMRSSATLRGEQYGYALDLGGPAVIFVLVVVGGFYLIKESDDFSMAVRLQPADQIADSMDTFILIDLDTVRVRKVFSSGEVIIPGVPARFRNAEIPMSLESHSLKLQDSKQTFRLPANGVLYLTVVQIPSSLRSNDTPAVNRENRIARVNNFAVDVPLGTDQTERHIWVRKGDNWEERVVNGRIMLHRIEDRIALNSCDGTKTKKEEDPALQFFLPDLGCPGMTILFRRDKNPWNAWLPMLSVNGYPGGAEPALTQSPETKAPPASSAQPKPAPKITKVCMGAGDGINCLAGADAKFDCNVYRTWGAGGKMNDNLGANFCSITENGVKKQQLFDVKVYQNNDGGGCGWTGFIVTCNP